MSSRLQTHYLGLSLDNPLVPSASPLTKDRSHPLQLEDAGASALVMHSLFEEEINHQHEQLLRFMHDQDIGHHEADSFLPTWKDHEYQDARDQYLEQLRWLKERLGIPVIASLNGISTDGWINHAREIEQAGADALELNVYYVAASCSESGEAVEQRYLGILDAVRQQVKLPITMKLSPQFSSPAHFAHRCQKQGAQGVVLFNRFYQPEIRLDSLHVEPYLQLSTSQESLSRIRWIAILRGQLSINIAATGGIHTAEDALKALLAGADVTHLCSALLMYGPEHLSRIKEKMLHWMDEHEYESIEQLKGSLSVTHAINPSAYERCNYLEVIDSYTSARGVRR